jgi:predicted negative regulator of RcsB-dependent stress response
MAQQQTIETEGWTFFDWLQANTKVLTIGAAAVVVGALGLWFYQRSGELKRVNAERGLNQAKQSIAAGNAPLAQTDLERVATRYKGTPAGAQAAMLLAQMRYDEGKFAEGLQLLDGYRSAAGPAEASVLALIGDGHLASGKAQEAADTYASAAEATSLKGEKAMYESKAARALMAAGKNAEAKAIWERLLANPDAAVMWNEAQMRIGELSAVPAGRS